MRFLLLAACLATAFLHAAEVRTPKHPAPYNIPLWEKGKVPLATGDSPLDNPFITVFLPPENARNGAAVIVAPGGGNIMMMYGSEGMEIAERLNDWGVAAFVLTYRLDPYKNDARVLDGNRALQLVRSRAAEWGISPSKIGFAGFSAGSSLGRAIPSGFKPANPSAADPIERVDSKVNFLILVYGPGRPSPGEQLSQFPPTFLLCAAWDRFNSNSSAQLFMDLNKAGAVVEAHLYQKGRHGFGAAYGSPEFSPWMDSLKHFLEQSGFIPKGDRR